MTEWKITEYCKKVVHSNVKDAVRYIFVGRVAATKKEGMRSNGCLLVNQNFAQSQLAAATFYAMLLELWVVCTMDRTYPQLPLLSTQGLRQLH